MPNAIRNIEVLQFSTPQQIYEFLPVTFSIKLKNRGNDHVVPTGDIFIDHPGDKKDTAIITVNDLKGNVLPDSNRIFEANWADGFPVYQEQTSSDKVVLTDSTGKPITKLTCDFSQLQKLRWGKYTANLLLVYDDGTKDVPIEGSLSFWVIPWRIIGGGLVVGLLISAGLWSMIGRPIGRVLRRGKRRKVL